MNAMTTLDIIGFGIAVFGLVVSVLFWALRVDGNIIEIKDNHLHTIEGNTGEMRDILLEIKTILEERRTNVQS